jgi:2-dehydropantoate 2-reductase
VRVCIVGAGAIGCYLGVMLASAGCRVSALARGETLAALRQHGMRLSRAGFPDPITVGVAVADDPRALGPQDLVVVSVKGTSLREVAGAIPPLLHQRTLVLPAMNGVPWWFFSNFGPSCRGLVSSTLDRDGTISRRIPVASVLGAVVFPNCERRSPGYAQHNFGDRIILGAQAEGAQSSMTDVITWFARAGLNAVTSADIHSDIWNKAVGNCVMNPVSAVTGATCDEILDDPALRDFCQAAMQELVDLGKSVGCDRLLSADDQIHSVRRMGKFKTSMLQDVESGNQLEIDPLTGVMSEIGRALGKATPRIDSLLEVARAFGRAKGLYARHT